MLLRRMQEEVTLASAAAPTSTRSQGHRGGPPQAKRAARASPANQLAQSQRIPSASDNNNELRTSMPLTRMELDLLGRFDSLRASLDNYRQSSSASVSRVSQQAVRSKAKLLAHVSTHLKQLEAKLERTLYRAGVQLER